jgi:hypothetical protein
VNGYTVQTAHHVQCQLLVSRSRLALAHAHFTAVLVYKQLAQQCGKCYYTGAFACFPNFRGTVAEKKALGPPRQHCMVLLPVREHTRRYPLYRRPDVHVALLCSTVICHFVRLLLSVRRRGGDQLMCHGPRVCDLHHHSTPQSLGLHLRHSCVHSCHSDVSLHAPTLSSGSATQKLDKRTSWRHEVRRRSCPPLFLRILMLLK